MKTERFTISLDEALLSELDVFLRRRKYGNRSEAIRDLIRAALLEQTREDDGDIVGVISLVYDHHQRQLQDRITDLQHDFHHQVLSTTHIHLNPDHCLEVILARGRAGRVRQLADRLTALRGVINGGFQAVGAQAAEEPHTHAHGG